MHWRSDCPNKETLKKAVAAIKDKTDSGTDKPPKKVHHIRAHFHSDDDLDICVDARDSLPPMSETAHNQDKEFTSLVARHKGSLTDSMVLNDNCSEISLFFNANLLTNVQPCPQLDVSGVGGTIRVSQQGEYKGISPVYLSPQSPANILAQAHLEDQAELSLHEHDYLVTMPNGDTLQFARRDDLGGLRVYDPSKRAYATVLTPTPTISGNLQALTPRDRAEANKALDLFRRTGFESSTSIARFYQPRDDQQRALLK